MPCPCPHPRSTFYSGLERPRRNQLGLTCKYFFPKWDKNARFPVPIPDPHFTRGWWGREETNQDSLAVISSPNERKMADALSPSQIHILFGVGEAEKKPIRTKLLHEEHSTSLNLALFTRRKNVINWRLNIRSNFPYESENDGRTITSLSHKNISSKIEQNVRVLKLKTSGPHEPWLFLDR